MTNPLPTSRRRLLGQLGASAAVAAGAMAGIGRLLGSEPVLADSTPTPSTSRGTTASTSAAPTSSTTTPGTAAPPTTTAGAPITVPLPAVVPYEPLPGEVEPEAKVAAARLVETLMSFAAGEDPTGAIDRYLQSAESDLTRDDIAARVGALFVASAASVGHVVYPQLGGLDPHHGPQRCAVMVVVDQHLRDEAGARAIGRCIDVRLRRGRTGWVLEDIGVSSASVPLEPAARSDAAHAVLGHRAIHLPDSVRWDIHDGVVDDRVLHELVMLADRAPIGVTSCRRGHPEHVFGTLRTSAHMAGRAVDVWSIGSAIVGQRTPGSLAHGLTEEIHRSGRVANLGSPWTFSGGRGAFTDRVHQDHIHLGFA